MPSQPLAPETRSNRLSVLTLAIASVSSVIAAVVVSRVWGPGTLFGAAATPLIITLVGEMLRKPAEVITVVRTPFGTQVREPGAPRLREIDTGALEAGDTVVAAPAAARRPRRPALLVALGSGLVAFVIAIVLLTSGELILGGSSVGSEDKRTTVFGGPARTTVERPAEPVITETTTTTVPAPAPPPTTEPAPKTTTEAPPPAPGAATGPTGPSGP